MENNESKHDINLLDALIVLARYKTMVFTIVFFQSRWYHWA